MGLPYDPTAPLVRPHHRCRIAPDRLRLRSFKTRPSTEDSAWQNELEAWRAQRAANLQAPEGWLSLIGLDWLQDGDNSFGSASDNRLQITAKIPAHLAVVRLAKGSVRLLPPPGGYPHELLLDGHPAADQDLISDDADQPSKLTIGSISIIVIHRDDRFALRIKDSQAATRVAFHGLKWYPPNPAYRVRARWIPYSPPKSLDIPTVLGTTTHMPAPGAAEFTLDGQTYRLEPVLEDPKATNLFFILRDATSKTTTYGAGRFLYTSLPDHGVDHPGDLWLGLQSPRKPALFLHSLRNLPPAPAAKSLVGSHPSRRKALPRLTARHSARVRWRHIGKSGIIGEHRGLP